LAAQGPSIFALSFRVDNYGSVRDAFAEEGAEMTVEFGLTDFSSIGLGEPWDGGIVDTRELLGSRLELVDASSGWEPGKAP
jgi:hypothetical protein